MILSYEKFKMIYLKAYVVMHRILPSLQHNQEHLYNKKTNLGHFRFTKKGKGKKSGLNYGNWNGIEYLPQTRVSNEMENSFCENFSFFAKILFCENYAFFVFCLYKKMQIVFFAKFRVNLFCKKICGRKRKFWNLSRNCQIFFFKF